MSEISMNNNIRWLRDRIKMLNLQGIIISNPINVKYLTGIDAEGTFLITGSLYFISEVRKYLLQKIHSK